MRAVRFSKKGVIWSRHGSYTIGDWYRHLGDWGATLDDDRVSPWMKTRKELRKWVCKNGNFEKDWEPGA